MQSWAQAELGSAAFGDQRLTRRFVSMAEQLANAPGTSIPHAFERWAPIKASYRFFSSSKVTPERILKPHVEASCKRAARQDRILALQDTTDLDFTTLKATSNLGYLKHAFQHGIKLHSVLALSTEGLPLGLLFQKYWSRPLTELGKKESRMQRPTEQRESFRWIEGLRASRASLPDSVEVIVVADREADFFDLLAEPRPNNVALLIRATHDRFIEIEAERKTLLLQRLEATAVAGLMDVEIPRSDGRPGRRAHLELRHLAVRLLRPRTSTMASVPSIALNVVLAREQAPRASGEAIEWLLLTTLPVENEAHVRQLVTWYSLRWMIERFHYVLKQGCRVEELQLEQAARLERAVALYSIVAWRLMWLLYSSREQPQASCETVLEREEWQLLHLRFEKAMPPEHYVPPLELVVLWIAKLGGFIGRKNDARPGVKVLWRGLRRLDDMVEGLRLARSHPLMGNA